MMNGKNVLVRENPADPNSPPVYDLSGNRICISLLIIRDGKKLNFACHLTPPTADRTIRLMRERNSYMVPSGEKEGGVDETPRGSSDVERAFFDEHSIGVVYGGKTLTVEQLDRIDRLNNIRVNAISNGLLMVAAPKVADPEADTEAPTLEELLAEDPSVEQLVLLADDNGVEHTLKIVHHFELPTAKQALEFQRTLKVRTIQGGARKIMANHKEVGKLYDAMIEKVDGVVGDRSAVIQSLPFAWKFNAVQMLFREAERKNV